MPNRVGRGRPRVSCRLAEEIGGRQARRDAPPRMPSKRKRPMTQKAIAAEPYEFTFDPASTALLIIDMQRDFVEPGGFGEALGNDVTPLQAVIAPCRRMLDAARRTGMLVIHTREGHSPDLADCPPTKIVRGRGATASAIPGRWAAFSFAASAVTTSSPSSIRWPGEVVIDKPGKGAFCATDLDLILHNRGHQVAGRLRRDDRSVRQHDGARGERPRLRVRRARRLRRLVLPRVPARRAGDDQGAGRHLRLGVGFEARACGDWRS